jgi:drug/metabolite transporter (DMT)-like permease
MLLSSILLLTILKPGMAVPLSSSSLLVVYCVFSHYRVYNLFYCLYLHVAKLPPEINSIYAYVNPIVAVLLGAVIFGETLTVAIGIGGLITEWFVYGQSFDQKNKRILAGNKV